jgi:hypothetical protein
MWSPWAFLTTTKPYHKLKIVFGWLAVIMPCTFQKMINFYQTITLFVIITRSLHYSINSLNILITNIGGTTDCNQFFQANNQINLTCSKVCFVLKLINMMVSKIWLQFDFNLALTHSVRMLLNLEGMSQNWIYNTEHKALKVSFVFLLLLFLFRGFKTDKWFHSLLWAHCPLADSEKVQK